MIQPTPRTARPITRQRMRTRLEEAFEDIAMILAQKHSEIERLVEVRSILTDAWDGTQPDEAPVFEISARVVKAS